MCCAIIFGFTFGGFVTGCILVLKKIFKDLRTSLGLTYFCAGVSSIIGPIVVGLYHSFVTPGSNLLLQGHCTMRGKVTQLDII